MNKYRLRKVKLRKTAPIIRGRFPKWALKMFEEMIEDTKSGSTNTKPKR